MAPLSPDPQAPGRQMTPDELLTAQAVLYDEAVNSAAILLRYMGRDPDGDPAVKDTPERWVKALREMTQGLLQTDQAVLARQFELNHDELVLLKGIRFTSLCEHHVLPFSGTAAVAYIPGGGKVVGLSKLARLVQAHAQRLQIQEGMTRDIAEAVQSHLHTRGVAVLIQAHHQCMGCRGVKQPGATMVTSALRGVFRSDPLARAEVLRLME